jgi:hypothetical protein
MSRKQGEIGENMKCYRSISEEEQMKAKPRHLTVLSPKKFLYPVKKFPRAL